ncbi:MAG TPA: DUF4965 domain-containing protein [Bacteroidota bacterium]|nr:DUF4965 domain-containing protein [Bacteroidota bacterium]
MNKTLLALSLLVFLWIPAILGAQPAVFRPPAVPLATSDPYFSIWSFADHPGKDWPRHWTGKNHALASFVRIDGKTYRALGNAMGAAVPAMSLVSTKVFPTRTVYEFNDGGVRMTLTFTTPLLPHDLEVFSRPVTYVSWEAASADGKDHAVSVYFDNSAELVVNTTDQEVTWSRFNLGGSDGAGGAGGSGGLDVLAIGSKDQQVLAKSGDDLRIDWGYFYLAAPKSQGGASVITDHFTARRSFTADGTLPGSDDPRMPRPARDDWPVLALVFNLGNVGATPVSRHLIMAYDDRFSIEYFHRKIRPYWRAGGMEVGDLLIRSEVEYSSLSADCARFDGELTEDLEKAGGDKYAMIASLAYRQAMAAHKLAADIDGTPLLFPKENFSNGCIATVDVIYPASPIFMLLSPELFKASLTPVLEYSMMPRWKFPFAPHDLGTYPKANGQVYGGGEETEENQMPVEESGNMLILLYAAARIDGSPDYALKYWPSVEKWARYLRNKGLDPENQLCTDDFAGHLAHNVNLSLKAILALGSYSKLCDMAGKKSEAERYHRVAREYASKWVEMADDGDHYRLAFDKPGTWSQKYNLVWDDILGLDLFPAGVAEKEILFYKSKQNRYGLPLDNRKDYTKSDWLVWTATLAGTRAEFEALISPLCDFLNETPDRVPFSDWYDTKTAKQVGFQARPVIGGVFIKMISDENIWRTWVSRGR